jgi:sulfur-oxidizing protein SoxX
MIPRISGTRLAGIAVLLAGAAAILYGCAGTPAEDHSASVEAQTIAMMKESFKAHGQAGLDRLDQDDTQRLCSKYSTTPPPAAVAKKIEGENLARVRYPADGKLMGDWKKGEKIAQLGRGMQFSDDPAKPAGANCYACHQLAPKELSYGTMGPSLYQFGKKRGYTEENRRYVWAKVYDAEAFSACTNMPRFGERHILTDEQIRDVVALLMDPESPVNR